MPDPSVWGDVATWVGSITTSATLAFTLYIVVGDRRKAEAQQARHIEVDYDPRFGPAGPESVTISVRNNSDKAIRSVGTQVYLPGKYLRYVGNPDTRGYWKTIDPGEEKVSEAFDVHGHSFASIKLRVDFRDVEGREWTIDCATEKLRRVAEQSRVDQIRESFEVRRLNKKANEIHDDVFSIADSPTSPDSS